MPRKKDTTPPPVSERESLLRRAERGDEQAAAEIRALLPVDKLASLTSLVKTVEGDVISRLASGNPVVRDSIRAQVALLKADVAGPDPSPLERLLADRVGVCWLEVAFFTAIYHQNAGDLSLDQGAHYQKRIDAAHRRYLSAIRTLAQVRRLALPMMQVNIAERQVNVAQPAPARGEN